MRKVNFLSFLYLYLLYFIQFFICNLKYFLDMKSEKPGVGLRFLGSPRWIHFIQSVLSHLINIILLTLLVTLVENNLTLQQKQGNFLQNNQYNKAIRTYIFVCMLAMADQTAGPNGLKFFNGTHGCQGSNIG